MYDKCRGFLHSATSGNCDVITNGNDTVFLPTATIDVVYEGLLQ